MVHQSRFLESVRDGPPHVPPGRRAGPGQDRGVRARGIRRRRVPAAGGRPQRREDELGTRGRALDAAAPRDRHLGRRRARRRVRGRVHRQLRDPRSPPLLAELDRPEGPGRRRGALHQEPRLAALAERARPRGPHPRAGAQPAAAGPHRHPADQRRRGLRRDLALPRLDDGREARTPADGAARRDGSDARRQGVLSRSARRRDLDGDRAPQEEGCRRRPSRQAHRRPAGRAG